MTFDLPSCFQCVSGVSRRSSEWLHAACGGVCQPGTGQRARRGANQHWDQVRSGALAEEPRDPKPLTRHPQPLTSTLTWRCRDSSGWEKLHPSMFLFLLFWIKHIWNRNDSLTLKHHLTCAVLSVLLIKNNFVFIDQYVEVEMWKLETHYWSIWSSVRGKLVRLHKCILLGAFCFCSAWTGLFGGQQRRWQ